MTRRISQLRRYSHRAMLAVAPAAIINSRARRRMIEHFAEKIGLVYFGTVDHQTDDHSLVRGITLSPHHDDDHYCIGTFEGYDITFVERSALLHLKGVKKPKQQLWHVLTVDLHIQRDIPRMFIGSHTHNELFYRQLLDTSPSFRKLPVENLHGHASQFHSHYSIYASPTHYNEIEQLLLPEVTDVIGKHFPPLAIEIADGVVYIYADQSSPSLHLFETMLKNGLWLAKYIDGRYTP